MIDTSLLKALLPLTQNATTKYRLSIETEYGLILEVDLDGTINFRLASQPTTAREPEAKKFRYYIWPDYGTNFMWYDPDWPHNPEGLDHCDEEDLESRYAAAWCQAQDKWVDKYVAAFEAAEAHLRSCAGKTFPDPEPETAWVLEGLLLSCWLALQPDVDAVGYNCASKNDDSGFEWYHISTQDDMRAALMSILAHPRTL